MRVRVTAEASGPDCLGDHDPDERGAQSGDDAGPGVSEVSRAFGAPATVASSNARSFFSTTAPTATGYPAGRTARRWTRQPATAPPIWSTGCDVRAPRVAARPTRHRGQYGRTVVAPARSPVSTWWAMRLGGTGTERCRGAAPYSRSAGGTMRPPMKRTACGHGPVKAWRVCSTATCSARPARCCWNAAPGPPLGRCCRNQSKTRSSQPYCSGCGARRPAATRSGRCR